MTPSGSRMKIEYLIPARDFSDTARNFSPTLAARE